MLIVDNRQQPLKKRIRGITTIGSLCFFVVSEVAHRADSKDSGSGDKRLYCRTAASLFVMKREC